MKHPNPRRPDPHRRSHPGQLWSGPHPVHRRPHGSVVRAVVPRPARSRRRPTTRGRTSCRTRIPPSLCSPRCRRRVRAARDDRGLGGPRRSWCGPSRGRRAAVKGTSGAGEHVRERRAAVHVRCDLHVPARSSRRARSERACSPCAMVASNAPVASRLVGTTGAPRTAPSPADYGAPGPSGRGIRRCSTATSAQCSPSLGNETPAGVVFDLKTLPGRLTFSPTIRAGVCDVSDPNARILHLHAGDPRVILPPTSDLSFCWHSDVRTARSSSTSLFAAAASRWRRGSAPRRRTPQRRTFARRRWWRRPGRRPERDRTGLVHSIRDVQAVEAVGNTTRSARTPQFDAGRSVRITDVTARGQRRSRA